MLKGKTPIIDILKEKYMNKQLIIADARPIFGTNFTGAKGRYNPAGNRTFNVELTQEQADELSEQGWNVKYHEPTSADFDPAYYLAVKINYNEYGGPNITMVTSLTGHQVALTEQTVGILDSKRILNMDLIINPYNWEMNGATGTSAYLETLYATVEEDPFFSKYNVE